MLWRFCNSCRAAMYHKLKRVREEPSVARPAFPAASKKGPAHIAGPAYISSAEIYFVQVLLIIFTSVTLKLPIASLLNAFSTCPSFFSSAFVSGLAVPVTAT